MAEKFKFVLLFILLNFFLIFSQDKTNNIAIIKNIPFPLSESSEITSEYIINLFEIELLSYSKVKLINITDKLSDELKGQYDDFYFKKLVNYVFSKGINAFFIIRIVEENNQIFFNVKLYNSIGDLMLNQNYIINSILNKNKLDDAAEKEIKNFINSFVDLIKENKEKKVKNINLTVKKYKLIHDYPLISFSVTALSTKIYFDDRMTEYLPKVFSLSPIDLRLAFFPLKYLETGIFCKFDINNMVYRYIDKDKIKYFESFFLFDYGIFLGFSMFFESAHYSFGLQVYNTYYNISKYQEWRKPMDFNSHFIPQFAFYQKIDFKIFKILYFSVIFNLKTNPMFYLKNDYFYSKPLNYDFITLEVSFVGLTVIF